MKLPTMIAVALLGTMQPAFAGQPMVTGGYSHALALASDGTVWSWGRNADGQLGDGTTTQRKTPVKVSGLGSVTAIAAGNSFSLALKSDGTVWGWGYNAIGQLGTGAASNGITSPVQTANLSSVKAIAAGYYHGYALKNDGTVWSWGANDYGQLGTGVPVTTSTKSPAQIAGLSGVTAIASGEYHGVALKSDGTVWAWGKNTFGQLGDGTTNDSPIPVRVAGMTGVTAVMAGYENSFALKADGTVWAWGMNATGQAGNGGDNSAVKTNAGQVSGGLSAVSTLASGSTQVLALLPGGAVWAWGGNSNGELGAGMTMSYSLLPLAVSKVKNVAAVGAGSYFALVVKNDGSVWTWGMNDNGQLGINTVSSAVGTPVQVLGSGGQGTLNLGETRSSYMGADCLFNWAETNYASLFSSAGAMSKVAAPFYYRYYESSRAYLGASTDGHLYYLGPASQNAVLDGGPLTTWLSTSGCT